MRCVVLGAALCGAASGALGQSACAVAGDVQRGVHLDFADGSRETYREIAPSILSVDGTAGAVTHFRLEVAHGTHLLSYVAITDGAPDEPSRQTYDYGADPAALPVPAAGARFNVEVTVTSDVGVRREDQLQAYVEGAPLRLAGCTYAAIDVLIAYDTQDNYIESIRYLPDLGIGYLMWNQSDGVQTDENVVVAITTGK